MTKKYKVQHNDYRDMFLAVCDDALNDNTEGWDVVYKVRNTLYRLNCKDRQFVLKCFAVPSVVKRFYYTFFCKSKACRAYENGLNILSKGNYTAGVVGYLEIVRYGLLGKSFFLTENLTGYKEIRNEMKGIGLTEKFTDALIGFIVDIHKKGICHKDLSPGNIMYSPDSLDFKIVDINRMQFFDSELDFETSARSLHRLSDGRWEILSELSRRYALARGFDPDMFALRVGYHADRFFVEKMYKWSVKRPERPHKNKVVYIAKLMFFVFAKKLRHLLGNCILSDRIKCFEARFYFKYLQYSDVRGVMTKKEGYKNKKTI